VREQELSTPAARVAAWAAAARRGEAGAGQREAGKAQEGTWHGLERRGGGWCTVHGWRGRRGVGQRKQRAEGWR
jgi:hypothetical protein